jgi:hypothetical protein
MIELKLEIERSKLGFSQAEIASLFRGKKSFDSKQYHSKKPFGISSTHLARSRQKHH